MKQTNRNIGIAALAIACAITASTTTAQTSFKGYQAAEWAKVTAEARREGHVVVYSQVVPPVMQRLKADFEKLNPGITVEVSRPQGIIIIADKERATSTDGADLLMVPDVNWALERSKQSMIVAPVGPATQGWPDRYAMGGTSPILAMEPFIIAYNQNLVKGPVTGYDDLLRPEFKGRLAIPELNLTLLMGFYDWLEETKGTEYLRKVAAQGPRMFASAVQSTQMVSAGELVGSLLTVPATITPLVAQGSPIRMTVPNPSVGFPYVGTILARSKRLNATQVFLDYLMSRAGQTAWASGGEMGSPLTGIPKSLDTGSIRIVNQDKFNPPDVSNAFRNKWNGIFKP